MLRGTDTEGNGVFSHPAIPHIWVQNRNVKKIRVYCPENKTGISRVEITPTGRITGRRDIIVIDVLGA